MKNQWYQKRLRKQKVYSDWSPKSKTVLITNFLFGGRGWWLVIGAHILGPFFNSS
jgi:hypothetical protein